RGGDREAEVAPARAATLQEDQEILALGLADRRTKRRAPHAHRAVGGVERERRDAARALGLLPRKSSAEVARQPAFVRDRLRRARLGLVRRVALRRLDAAEHQRGGRRHPKNALHGHTLTRAPRTR